MDFLLQEEKRPVEARITKEHQSLPIVLESNLFLKFIIKTAYSKRTKKNPHCSSFLKEKLFYKRGK